MVDASVLAAKLRDLAERIARVRSQCPPTAAALAADQNALDLVSFNLMLAVQICLDMASHLIGDEGWPPAATAAEAFRRLSEHGVLSRATAEVLGRAVGLRNVVAHGYAAVDPEQIFFAAGQGLGDLEQFSREVSSWVAERPSGGV
jgi:uncharacterized protein YutE (UPF0331/DUF86 family)